MSSITKSTKKSPDIVMLDNLDSFTYNLVDEFRCLGYELTIYRNTISAEFIFEKLSALNKSNPKGVILVLSPGPGDPSHAGCLMELISLCAGKFPILGICLGHQALIQHYGGVIDRAPEVIHGKSSNITHTQNGAFTGIANPLPVARYHSLVASDVPDVLTMTAHFNAMIDGKEICLPMAIEHTHDAVIGFQFHPESILTTYGTHLLAQSFAHLLTLSSTQLTSQTTPKA